MKRKRPRTPRIHGDSYADVSSREPDLAGTVSTHGEDVDRRSEEPADGALDAPERLEGSLE